MSNLGEALSGAGALILGGIIFLLFSSTFGSGGLLNFGFWGIIFLVFGILGVVTVVGVGVGSLLGGGL